MNTIIIENANKETTSLFKKLADMLDVVVSVKNEKEVKLNAELLKDIRDYENGKLKTVKYDEVAVKKLLK